MTASYIDTSALAKWYLNEARSDDFEAFLRREQRATISRLTVLEFRCLLARRRRSRDIDGRMENRVFSAFENDVRAGFLSVHPLEDAHALAALEILTRLKSHPLRSLDALHLAIAHALGVAKIATADRVLAEAAAALGFEVERFD
ncbi:MAG: type II toxin-antitoxin system VapC family toxin [Acidobacteria bacterium]|nr:type II toxin-antitoxin system VapC family toxin [Acidobacteriota bacterium]